MPYLISKSHVWCDLFFTTNLNRQASEQSANVCVAWQVTSAFCVCSLIDNGREPIRNEDSGFFVVKQFCLFFILTGGAETESKEGQRGPAYLPGESQKDAFYSEMAASLWVVWRRSGMGSRARERQEGCVWWCGIFPDQERERGGERAEDKEQKVNDSDLQQYG